MKAPYLTQAQLTAMLTYDETSGDFTWKVRSDARPQWNGRYAGKRAGYVREATGGGLYISIRIFDWPFAAHRLAWLYMTGKWPKEMIDHKNGDGTDNCWSNLREASRSQNGANASLSKRNASGLKGVSVCKKTGRFRATIGLSGRQKWLGTFDCPQEAHAAYMNAAKARSAEFARAK